MPIRRSTATRAVVRPQIARVTQASRFGRNIPSPDSTQPRARARPTVARVAIVVNGVQAPGSPVVGDGTIELDVATPGTPTVPLPHAITHQNGGTDEINLAGLSGLLADAQTPLAHTHPVSDIIGLPPTFPPSLHAASHQNGGADEISVAGLSGLLADPQTPLTHVHNWTDIAGKPTTFPPTLHAASHQNGGADEINVAGLSGLLADPQMPTAHSHNPGDIFGGVVTSLTGTVNRVTVSAATGAITLSTPQDTHTGATPQFARMGLGAAATGLANEPLLVSGAGAYTAININNTGAGGAQWQLISNSALASQPVGGLLFWNGSARMVIDSGGRVGIGTTVPEELLHVFGAVKIQSTGFDRTKWRMIVEDLTSIGTYQIQGFAGGFYTSILSLQHGGNVGIGTTAPLAKLHVAGSTGQLYFDGNTSVTRLMLYPGGGTNDYGFGIDTSDLVAHFGAGGGMRWRTGSVLGTQLMRLTGAGVLTFGSAEDTNLYRYGANVLRTDDEFWAANRIAAIGSGYVTNPTYPIFGQYNSTVGYIQAPAGGMFQIWKPDTSLHTSFQADGFLWNYTGGIYLGAAADVNLYRAAANVLHTDDSFRVGGGLEVTAYLLSSVGALYLRSDSAIIRFGAGDDVNLYRNAANQLRTDDLFLAGGDVYAAYPTSATVAMGDRIGGGLAGITFGSAADTNLYRSAANWLRTDDNFHVNLQLNCPQDYGHRLTATKITGAGVEVNTFYTGGRYAIIDLVGDDTYTPATGGGGLRLLRENSGANAPSNIIHRGSGSMRYTTMSDSVPHSFLINGGLVCTIRTDGIYNSSNVRVVTF